MPNRKYQRMMLLYQQRSSTDYPVHGRVHARITWWSKLIECFHPTLDEADCYVRIAEEKEPEAIAKKPEAEQAVQGRELLSNNPNHLEAILHKLKFIKRDSNIWLPSVRHLLRAGSLEGNSNFDRKRYLSGAAQLLCLGFPSHWDTDEGHQIASWPESDSGLPHVERLADLVILHGLESIDAAVYSDVLLRCGWHLYEREEYPLALSFVAQVLDIFPNKQTNAYASAVDLSGLISLDLADARTALPMFEKALEVRRLLYEPRHPFIAYSLNNIALACTELSMLQGAYQAHEAAISIRLENATHRIGNSYSNLASLLLRMGDPDKAELTLMSCPVLKDFSDETFLATDNPRFSGDMVLLSRIRRAQGRDAEALRLAYSALEFRRRLLGNHLKTCDSLNDVASMLLQQGDPKEAFLIWEDLAGMAEMLPEGKGQLARANWRIASLEQDPRLAGYLKYQAIAVRNELRPDWVGRQDDGSFEGLCLWMLW